MIKSKWIEAIEWCVLAFIALFMIGVFLSGTEQDAGRAENSVIHTDE